MCVAPGCKPQVVAVYYLEPGMLVCPAQMDGTVYWHNTPVIMSGIAVVVSALRGPKKHDFKNGLCSPVGQLPANQPVSQSGSQPVSLSFS